MEVSINEAAVASPPAYAPEEKDASSAAAQDFSDGSGDSKLDHTKRNLKSRHVQLIGIGGTIGTALFVQIGKGLLAGGIWCMVVLAVTVCMAEMVTFLPISSPFIRFAGRYVDEAFGFAAGWNFFVFEAALVPFEIVACNVILHFWTDAIPTAVVIVVILFLYLLINLLAVKWYGESEFWAAVGKVVLAVGLIGFTFVVMLGGNPRNDRFGFRYWSEPGAFAELYYTGSLGRFLGFLQCLIQASFTIAGPDYVSMAAGEAENPRSVLPRAFNAVFYRLTTFFVLGALCVGILVPYNDAELTAALNDGRPGAAASPYVVAMDRLNIGVLPHLVNVLVLTAAFSAGNSYCYCASRSLYGLALEGKAPRFLAICTRSGVPIYSVLVVLAIGLIAFLQLSSGSAVVLSWIVSLVTASQLMNFCAVAVTYLCFYRAIKAQGIDRRTLPYRAKFMPYAAWIAFAATLAMVFVGGYTVFLPLDGMWSVPSFLFSYLMVMIFPVLYVGWKIIHRTKFVRPMDIDFQLDQQDIKDYEDNYIPQPANNMFERILDKLFG
ncbi:hypothetical protein GMORB2_4912 [Geosmithia morbida]|uniref:Amino acid permease/ SLC12A domain-containing protein n=1 Tax=Geosmithia morbida TaxID=1094350 RepID=A0A9P4YLX0_9HYPO|nr:uncharacterized protein GMORB2_4912 [Geosmithia morbida]KAF4119393.1 hypothetical protein GMORB2_4912 [Geosmithia morbida]